MQATGTRSDDLLTRLSWTRRLAARLVADAGLAEDLVQDAWLEYLTRPPRPTGSLNGWFARVMRNLARQRGRRDGRRRELEREEAGDGTGEATVELVARAQAQRSLVEAVLELDPPYRDVVLLRYFEELESPAIARRLGMPASTVRTRLQHALALLRRRLEARHGPEARSWLAAILPLLPRPRLERGAAALTRGWLWGAPLGAAALVSAVLLASPSEGPPELTPPPAAPAAAAVARGAPLESSAPEPSRTGTRAPARDALPGATLLAAEAGGIRGSAAEPDEPGPATLVRVQVDGEPARQGSVYLSPLQHWIDPETRPGHHPAHRRPVDPAGPTVFEEVATSTGSVGFEPSPGAAIVQRIFRRTPESGVIELEAGTARIEGRAWDPAGRPVEGALVTLGVRVGHDYGALRARDWTDAHGRFAFDGLPAADFWLHAGGAVGIGETRAHGTLAKGEQREIDLGRPTGRVHWSGRIVDAAGEPVTDGEAGPAARLEFALLDGGAEREFFPAVLTPGGTYSIELVPGAYAVRRAPGGCSSSQLLAPRLEVREDARRDLVLAGARVHGTAHLAGRGTVPDPLADGRFVLQLIHEDGEGGTTRHETAVDSEGRFRFVGLGPGRWVLGGERLAEEPIVLDLGPEGGDRLVDVEVR